MKFYWCQPTGRSGEKLSPIPWRYQGDKTYLVVGGSKTTLRAVTDGKIVSDNYDWTCLLRTSVEVQAPPWHYGPEMEIDEEF